MIANMPDGADDTGGVVLADLDQSWSLEVAGFAAPGTIEFAVFSSIETHRACFRLLSREMVNEGGFHYMLLFECSLRATHLDRTIYEVG